MNETITEALMAFTKDHLLLHILLIVLSSILLLVSMGVDLIFGVRKAKIIGQATTSAGLKKTCDKARKYFSPYLVLICIDIMSCVIIPVPVFSMLWAAYCVFCEFTSVREKSWQKEELRKAERTMNIVVENKEDIAKMVVELLTGDHNKKTDE